MCRLMKSKAISRKTGEFVIGYYYCTVTGYKQIDEETVEEIKEHKIIYRDEYRTEYIASVDPKTVCRNTGAYDKYGNWVFENDIVKIGKYEYVVVWDEERNGYALKCDGHKYQFFNIKERPEIEVIGNIFSGKTKALR